MEIKKKIKFFISKQISFFNIMVKNETIKKKKFGGVILTIFIFSNLF